MPVIQATRGATLLRQIASACNEREIFTARGQVARGWQAPASLSVSWEIAHPIPAPQRLLPPGRVTRQWGGRRAIAGRLFLNQGSGSRCCDLTHTFAHGPHRGVRGPSGWWRTRCGGPGRCRGGLRASARWFRIAISSGSRAWWPMWHLPAWPVSCRPGPAR